MKRAQLMRKIGWRCFMLMWIPFGTMFIGMMGMPEGSYAFEEFPPITQYSLVIGGILAVAAMVLIPGAFIASMLANRAILKNGQLAQAKIINLSETGTRINHQPVVRILLEVQPPGQPAFQAETEKLISILQIPQLQPGATVQVKYDPESKEVALMG